MNVLVVYSDDQREDTLRFMPEVHRTLIRQGTRFSGYRLNVPVCQPARIGVLTGQRSKRHGQLLNTVNNPIDHNNTIGKWMDDAGFRTGFIGKYMNAQATISPKPTGWDTWNMLTQGAGIQDAYGYDIHDGTSSVSPTPMQLDELVTRALAFIGGAEPWFLHFCPTNPHTPFNASAADLHRWLWYSHEIVDEPDVSDKEWMTYGALTAAQKETIRLDVRAQLREVSALDRAIGVLADAVDPSDTYLIFASDSGIHWGEHNLQGDATKNNHFDVSLRGPCVMRGPGVEAGIVSTAPCSNEDLTATCVDIANATPGLTTDGLSLLSAIPADRVLLHEVAEDNSLLNVHPDYDGITTGPGHPDHPSRKLFRSPSKRVNPAGPFTFEAYDLDTDPNEWANWAAVPGRLAERDALEALLVAELA